MGRVIIYSLLFCLVLVTAYLYINKPGDESVTNELLASPIEKPVESLWPVMPPPSERLLETVNEPGGSPDSQTQIRIDAEPKQATEGDRELSLRAAEKLKAGEYGDALKLYRELSERDKGAFTGVGILYFKIGDYDNAQIFLEKAVEHNGNDFIARKFLALVYYRKDDIDKALSHAEIGLSMKKDPELQKLYDKLRKDKTIQESHINESTLHFKITFDGYRHGGISRKIIDILEDAYSTIGKELNYFPTDPVNVVLYTNRDFYDVTQVPEWSRGIYDGKIRVPVKGAEGNEGVLKKVLFHEYTHAVVHSITPRCPLWINEGLAEYFSGNYPKKIGQVIPLNALENSFSWLSRENIGIAYWESYSAVSYLIDRYGFYRIKEFLLALLGGADLNQAFRGAFSITYKEFTSSWGKG